MSEAQEELVKKLLGMHRVNTIDDRGHYIVHGDGNIGVYIICILMV